MKKQTNHSFGFFYFICNIRAKASAMPRKGTGNSKNNKKLHGLHNLMVLGV